MSLGAHVLHIIYYIIKMVTYTVDKITVLTQGKLLVLVSDPVRL